MLSASLLSSKNVKHRGLTKRLLIQRKSAYMLILIFEQGRAVDIFTNFKDQTFATFVQYETLSFDGD